MLICQQVKKHEVEEENSTVDVDNTDSCGVMKVCLCVFSNESILS